jgi:hypothetical protein
MSLERWPQSNYNQDWVDAEEDKRERDYERDLAAQESLELVAIENYFSLDEDAG